MIVSTVLVVSKCGATRDKFIITESLTYLVHVDPSRQPLADRRGTMTS